MRFLTFLKLICFMTILSLIYTHMQVDIIDLAYQGKKKENQIRQLNEDNGNLHYTISSLKSAYHIGVKMLSENSQMKFADPENVIHFSTTDDISTEEAFTETSLTKKGSFLSFLQAFGSRAQADDHR